MLFSGFVHKKFKKIAFFGLFIGVKEFTKSSAFAISAGFIRSFESSALLACKMP